jgi:hypothetical protein
MYLRAMGCEAEVLRSGKSQPESTLEGSKH